MIIRFDKSFKKQYNKLPSKLQRQTESRLKLFEKDPSLKQLNDHPLYGKYQGYRSINITGDVRALYYQSGDTMVLFAFIGTHSQLYG